MFAYQIGYEIYRKACKLSGMSIFINTSVDKDIDDVMLDLPPSTNQNHLIICFTKKNRKVIQVKELTFVRTAGTTHGNKVAQEFKDQRHDTQGSDYRTCVLTSASQKYGVCRHMLPKALQAFDRVPGSVWLRQAFKASHMFACPIGSQKSCYKIVETL